MMPFTVEPTTIPTICGAVSGAETSAVRPSKTPRIPPRTRPKTGLFIGSSIVGPSLLTAFRGESLTLAENQEKHAHDEVGEDEQDRCAVSRAQASRAFEQALSMGGHWQGVEIVSHVRREL